MRHLLLVLSLLAPIARLDAQVQQAVQRMRSPWLERPMRIASDVGQPVVVLGTLLAIVVIEPATGVPVARAALLALVPTNLAVEALKRASERPRPDGERNPANSSLPSSHAANAFALAAVFARRWPRAGSAFYLGAALIAFSRMYLNRHYPSDVLVGVALGLLCAWPAALLYRRRAARGAAPS
jgi:membrane-associated phospholipid phosphatase